MCLLNLSKFFAPAKTITTFHVQENIPGNDRLARFLNAGNDPKVSELGQALIARAAEDFCKKYSGYDKEVIKREIREVSVMYDQKTGNYHMVIKFSTDYEIIRDKKQNDPIMPEQNNRGHTVQLEKTQPIQKLGKEIRSLDNATSVKGEAGAVVGYWIQILTNPNKDDESFEEYNERIAQDNALNKN